MWMNLLGLAEFALWYVGCIWFFDNVAPKLFDWAMEPIKERE